MRQKFEGWDKVATLLRKTADDQQVFAAENCDEAARLNHGQRATLRAIADRITDNGLVIADEVGMGKTRIAVEVARCVKECGGRVAIVVPPGLGYQWQSELRDGGLGDVPPILRSLDGYLKAWKEGTGPWFDIPAVVVSHIFANWRLGGDAKSWRWALLPEIYAHLRLRRSEGRLPRDYRGDDKLAAAQSKQCDEIARCIVDAMPSKKSHPIRKLLEKLLQFEWKETLNPNHYSTDGIMRIPLEQCVGAGLGVFDLIIIDEAHKSRDLNSTLSRLLDNMIVASNATRRIALTATPVELDVDQWVSTLNRLKLDDDAVTRVKEASSQYAEAVRRIQKTWRTSPEARAAFGDASSEFHYALKRYLLRRDKREDSMVKTFAKRTGLSHGEYRNESVISIEPESLSETWRQAICAAEALSVVTRNSEDPVAKRLRLTLGNGHGVANILDQYRPDQEDNKQREWDEDQQNAAARNTSLPTATSNKNTKREARAQWWMQTMQTAFAGGDAALFDHPAILKVRDEIESETSKDRKVLVFGKFTRPMRALVDLLNAREMLRCVQNGLPWPQTKVHGARNASSDESEWPAVRAAHRQLCSPVSLESLDTTLKKMYDVERRRRDSFTDGLIAKLERGIASMKEAGGSILPIFQAFKHATQVDQSDDRNPLTIVSRAVADALGNNYGSSSDIQCAEAFHDLVLAAMDHDDADAIDEADGDANYEHWNTIESRLDEEYSHVRGSFARLMHGPTRNESRKMIQQAFNRPNSFPRVLVAQSVVGREGLNLHRACRVVILLHLEWNPGVVEQQVGRIDRVGSLWCQEMQAIAADRSACELPRIEVRQVVFRGTYDEQNWQVLKQRMDNNRAQLHGIIIPPSAVKQDKESKKIIDIIEQMAPNFSPTLQYGDSTEQYRSTAIATSSLNRTEP